GEMARSEIKLTAKTVAKLKAPDPSGKQVIHWDDTLRGFGILCSGVTNSRSYIAQRDTNGKTRRVTLGSCAEISLEEGRRRAAETADGRGGGDDRRARRKAPATLRTALTAFLSHKKNLRPNSIRAYGTLAKYLPEWLDLPLAEIDGDMVEAKHRDLQSEIK